MGRIIPGILCLAFAASLHASVPAVQTAPPSAKLRLEQVRTRGALPLTAAPADRQSFFAEFYTVEHSPAKARRKAGLFKRFSTLVRRTAQKVNFFD